MQGELAEGWIALPFLPLTVLLLLTIARCWWHVARCYVLDPRTMPGHDKRLFVRVLLISGYTQLHERETEAWDIHLIYLESNEQPENYNEDATCRCTANRRFDV